MWPPSIAPFAVHIVVVNVRDEAQAKAGEALYAECRERLGYLLGRPRERPGVKFKDADLSAS